MCPDINLNDYMYYIIYLEYCEKSGETKADFLEDGYTENYFSLDDWYAWEVKNGSFSRMIYSDYEQVHIVIHYHDSLKYERCECDSLLREERLDLGK